MPKLLAYILEARGRARPVVLQENVTPATLAHMRGFKVAKVALTPQAVATDNIFAWQNPENNPILVTRVIIDVTTGSAGAAFIDVDVVDSAIATDDDIIDATTVQNDLATPQIIDHLLVAGDGVGGVHLVAANGALANAWITGRGSAASTGLVGNAYIIYQEV